jgi:hypothetical protein
LINARRKYKEVLLSDVVSISTIGTKAGISLFIPSITSYFEVNTYSGTLTFDGFGIGDIQNCAIFRHWVEQANSNHNLRKKILEK